MKNTQRFMFCTAMIAAFLGRPLQGQEQRCWVISYGQCGSVSGDGCDTTGMGVSMKYTGVSRNTFPNGLDLIHGDGWARTEDFSSAYSEVVCATVQRADLYNNSDCTDPPANTWFNVEIKAFITQYCPDSSNNCP